MVEMTHPYPQMFRSASRTRVSRIRAPPRAHFTHDYTPIYTHIGEALVRLVDQPPVVEIMFANALGDGQLNAVRMMIVVECDRQRSFEVRIEIRVQIGQVDDG